MRRVLAVAALAAATGVGLPSSVHALETKTVQVCVGDVAPGKCWSDENFNCQFATANASNTDSTAARLACAKRGLRLFNYARIDVHDGDGCGYIVLSVTCSDERP